MNNTLAKKAKLYASTLLLSCAAFVPALHSQEGMTLRPAGGERFHKGQSHTIAWDRQTAGPVNIFLWDGEKSAWALLASDVNSPDGRYDWLVPSYLEGTKFRIRVQSSRDPRISWISESFFQILEAKALVTEVGEPEGNINGLSIWPVPAGQEMFVRSDGRIPVKIEMRNMLGEPVSVSYSIHGNEMAVATAGLNGGAYLVKVLFDDGSAANRVVIVNK